MTNETHNLITENGYMLANSDLKGILLDLHKEGKDINLMCEIMNRMDHQQEIRRAAGFEMEKEEIIPE